MSVPSSFSPADTVAAIVIGRNEGDRLKACLAALGGRVTRIIYVDSGLQRRQPDGRAVPPGRRWWNSI